MIYYKHKTSGEIIGSLNNLRDLIDMNGNMSCITDVIIPNIGLGNGIISHCMYYSYIRQNYKRIRKTDALLAYPDFGQWRHIDDEHNFSILHLGGNYLHELLPMRSVGFGIAFTALGKAKLNKNKEMELSLFESR